MMLFASPLSGIIKIVLIKDASHLNITRLTSPSTFFPLPTSISLFEIASHLQS